MIRASCLCGGVRFEIRGELFRASHCHCAMCRKAHGAAFATYAQVRKADLRLVQGEELVAAYESSPGIRRSFCVRCGSTLQWINTARPDTEDIALGIVDGDPGVRPACHIYVGSKAPWYDIGDGLPQHPEGQP